MPASALMRVAVMQSVLQSDDLKSLEISLQMLSRPLLIEGFGLYKTFNWQMIQRCNESLQSGVEFVCFSHSLWVGDSHLYICVCVNDLVSLWDTERRTWHVATRGQQWQTQTNRCCWKGTGGGRGGDGGRGERGDKRKKIGSGKNCGWRGVAREVLDWLMDEQR